MVGLEMILFLLICAFSFGRRMDNGADICNKKNSMGETERERDREREREREGGRGGTEKSIHISSGFNVCRVLQPLS